VLQGTIASEEEDLPVAVEETFSGNYVVVFDPLDGSSNIDAGISTGSIFGIYDPNDECSLEVAQPHLHAGHLSDWQFPKLVELKEYGCLKGAVCGTHSWIQEYLVAALH
jgi:Fructose-1-6-bisphosphatase, N-terminal domain